MSLLNDVKQLSKQAVKLDRAFEATNPKCTIRLRRMLKRAFSLEKKLIVAVGKLMPQKPEEEVREMAKQWLAWTEERMNRRHGRILQNPVPRTERRLTARGLLSL